MSFDDLDSGTSRQITSSLADAMKPAEHLARESLAGTQNVGALLNDGGDFNRSAGFGNDQLLSAINRKTRQNYDMGQRQMRTTANYEALNQKMDRLKTAGNLAMQEHQANQQARMMRYQERQRKKAMRGQILGSVLGIAGAVGGLVATGGNPAGAMAGASIGQGLGNTMGGV